MNRQGLYFLFPLDNIIPVLYNIRQKEVTTLWHKRKLKRTNASEKKSYDRIEITVPKGDREKIVQAASAAGMSVNAFIKEALAEYIAHTTKQ